MRKLVAGVLLLSAMACSDGVTAPLSSVNGTWSGFHPDNSFVVTLTERGAQVTGTGTYFRNINPSTGTVTAAGFYAAPHLTMAVTDDQGNVFQFAGDVQDVNHIAGIQSVQGVGSDSLTLTRLTTP